MISEFSPLCTSPVTAAATLSPAARPQPGPGPEMRPTLGSQLGRIWPVWASAVPSHRICIRRPAAIFAGTKPASAGSPQTLASFAPPPLSVSTRTGSGSHWAAGRGGGARPPPPFSAALYLLFLPLSSFTRTSAAKKEPGGGDEATPSWLARQRARSPEGERAAVELAVGGTLLSSPHVCTPPASRTAGGGSRLCCAVP